MTKSLIERKHSTANETYFDYLDWILASDEVSRQDLIFHFPAYLQSFQWSEHSRTEANTTGKRLEVCSIHKGSLSRAASY